MGKGVECTLQPVSHVRMAGSKGVLSAPPSLPPISPVEADLSALTQKSEWLSTRPIVVEPFQPTIPLSYTDAPQVSIG
jgi:hypothetical protein